jgi:ribosome-binding protein aMBF1 (putative translation factor)
MAEGDYQLRPKSEMCRDLGRRFREARESRGVSLRQLSDAIGVNLYLIRQHEAGAHMLRTDKLVEAALYLKYRPGELVYVKGQT